ncbi:hypothetical protein Cni_G07528 [Canna indica]|uniref:Uncharacterized protein n=1 Tax=Canna indica TaxID=4628 RepID=A0AAQ3K2A1_9LILI|nr:hypothetical protein Cni_G07528 [Canna indica]
MELPSPPPPPPPPPPAPASLTSPSSFSISDLPSSSSTLPSTVDLSMLFDPPAPQPAWPLRHQHQQQQRLTSELGQQRCTTTDTRNLSDSSGCGGGDLQALARELLDRHRSTTSEAPPIDLKVTKHNVV